MQMLRDEQSGPRGKQQVEEMLRRLEEEQAEIFHPLDLKEMKDKEEGDGLWDSLTETERRDFHRLVHSGDIGALVPLWIPWWVTEGETQSGTIGKILELSDSGNVSPHREGLDNRGTEPSTTKNPDRMSGRDQTEIDHGSRINGDLYTAQEPSECPGQEMETKVTKLPADPSSIPGVQDHVNAKKTWFVEQKSASGEHRKGERTNTAEHLEKTISRHRNRKGKPDTQMPYSLNSQGNHVKSSEDSWSVKDGVNSNKQCRSVDVKHIDLKERNDIAKENQDSLTDGNTGVLKEKHKHLAEMICPEVKSSHKLSEVPAIFSYIPPLNTLCRNPSNLVQYSLVNVLYAYAFSLLRHNGDLNDDVLLEFVEMLLRISGALSSSDVFISTAQALQSAVRIASATQLDGDEGTACVAIEATSHILLGDGSKLYVLAALAHLSRALGRARKLVENKDVRRAVFNGKKKCMFLAAWVNENENCLFALSKEAIREHKTHLQHMCGVTEISSGLQKVWGGKRPPEKKILIQEIPIEIK
ncbi:hypothetical protein GDO86_008621 [Hymenochirus boettgeri]|uniref:Zinc finger HIT domain-containing protein 2 n=1 Tax=Hymenochirus boettgeri TaxID=247094 RepID=A0A8T2J159_9PIPI|nr:hypothetical protein GDO86_008621 [Hymenochirus boettgeri]